LIEAQGDGIFLFIKELIVEVLQISWHEHNKGKTLSSPSRFTSMLCKSSVILLNFIDCFTISFNYTYLMSQWFGHIQQFQLVHVVAAVVYFTASLNTLSLNCRKTTLFVLSIISIFFDCDRVTNIQPHPSKLLHTFIEFRLVASSLSTTQSRCFWNISRYPFWYPWCSFE